MLLIWPTKLIAIADVTTGADIARAGAAALVFAVGGAVWTAVLQRRMPDTAMRSSWGVMALVGLGGSVAILVGFICWATGTEFGA